MHDGLSGSQPLFGGILHDLSDKINKDHIFSVQDRFPLSRLHEWELTILFQIVTLVHLCHIDFGWSA